MNHPVDKSYILQFLQTNHLGILSTVNNQSAPDAAPIYCFPHAAFELYFITPKGSQKLLNIEHNSSVVVTFVSADLTETVQIRGNAKITNHPATESLGQLAQSLNYDANFLTTLPVLKYEKQEKVVVKIIPTEVRFRSYTEHAFIERKFDAASLTI